MKRKVFFALIWSSFYCFGYLGYGQETLLYEERFVNTTGSNAELTATTGWIGYTNLDPEPIDLQPASGAIMGGVSGGAGYEVSFDDNDLGYIFLYGPEDNQILVTSGWTVDRSVMEISRVDFVIRETTDNYQYATHVALKIGGKWYVHDEGIRPSEPAPDVRTYALKTWTFDPTDWHEYNFDPADTASMGFASNEFRNLPLGNVTDFGFWIRAITPGAASRIIDEVSLYTVASEPQEPDDWFGYEVADGGWVDASDWIGWINNSWGDNWVWSVPLDKFIYVPDAAGWVFVPRE